MMQYAIYMILYDNIAATNIKSLVVVVWVMLLSWVSDRYSLWHSFLWRSLQVIISFTILKVNVHCLGLVQTSLPTPSLPPGDPVGYSGPGKVPLDDQQLLPPALCTNSHAQHKEGGELGGH